jgi:hypothetical protein
MREKSSTVFTSFSMRSALRCAVCEAAAHGGRGGIFRASASWSGESRSVSGVRNSWLTF